MGYFSNGIEGELYREEYCMKCRNWRKKKEELTDGCPIMDLHFSYSYELCNSKSIAKKMLDFLIPQEKIYNLRCRMFLRK